MRWPETKHNAWTRVVEYALLSPYKTLNLSACRSLRRILEDLHVSQLEHTLAVSWQSVTDRC